MPRGVPAVTPIAVVHAEGAVLTDADGNRLIDFGGGIGVVNAGHRHPGVVEAVREQLDRFTHVCFPVSTYEPYVELAERLNALTPGSHEKRTFFVNSGAEAVENAIKAARHFTGRQAVVCFEHGFHGRTYLGDGAHLQGDAVQEGFRAVRARGVSDSVSLLLSLSARRRPRRRRAAAAWPAATTWSSHFAAIVDPELGRGDHHGAGAGRGRLRAGAEGVRRRRSPSSPRHHGILFIADEIQTGFGRTGRLFACEHYGLVPDLITTAKSLAGGLPLAAVTGRADVMESAQVGGLGGTYGGNPLACAAALAVLDAMEAERIPSARAAPGERITARFQQWAAAVRLHRRRPRPRRHGRDGAGEGPRRRKHPGQGADRASCRPRRSSAG